MPPSFDELQTCSIRTGSLHWQRPTHRFQLTSRHQVRRNEFLLDEKPSLDALNETEASRLFASDEGGSTRHQIGHEQPNREPSDEEHQRLHVVVQ